MRIGALLSAPDGALAPCSISRASSCDMAERELSRVLVCVGHLCECQQDGVGARALLRELQQDEALSAPVEETVCLGMCGMGAMGCVEYADGSETLTMGREQMLTELKLDAAPKAVPESCAVEVATDANVQKILVCTGRMCQREKGGGTELLDELQRSFTSLPVEAAPCLGQCGSGSLMRIEYADGCETEVSSSVARVATTLDRLGIGAR